jgi:hypothetical protein
MFALWAPAVVEAQVTEQPTPTPAPTPTPTPTPTPEPTPTPTPNTEGQPTPPQGVEQPPPASDAPPAERTLEERVTQVEGLVEGMSESSAATNSVVDALRKIKLSGYVQGRYEWQNDASFGLGPTGLMGAPRGRNRFYVRRARLKTTYSGDLSEFVLQLDAAESVALRDAEASLVLNETVFGSAEPWELKITLGQFKVPFGFELLQSSSDRELPERARVITQLFPGERDRGMRLSGRYGIFRLNSALINGNFTTDTVHGAFDQTSWKDVAARLGVDLEWIVVGGSLHWGHTLKLAPARAATMTQAALPPVYSRYDRLRLGADTQLYFEIPGLGGLSLRGEAIWANDVNMDFSGMPEDRCQDQKSFGWYVTVVQNFGNYFGAALRFDQYDPYRKGLEGCPTGDRDPPEQRSRFADLDRVSTWSAAALVYFSGNLKGTINFDHVSEQGTQALLTDDILRFQLQARF